ncbi:MAG: 50S ribosomal protein L37ae [Thermoprotei archaeon]
MGKLKVTGPAGSFGSRYGTSLRKRWIEVITEYRKPKICPKCGTLGQIKRIKSGLWVCHKCGNLFAGGAYVTITPIGKMSVTKMTMSTKETQQTQQ